MADQTISPAGPLCRHCSQPKVNRPRGLCWSCYYTPGVKELYPPTSKYAPTGEPTAAEVEALIAEQSANLPDWWDAETRALRDEEAET